MLTHRDSSQTSEPGSISNSSRLTSFPALLCQTTAYPPPGCLPQPCRAWVWAQAPCLRHTAQRGGRGPTPDLGTASTNPTQQSHAEVTFSGRLCPENHRARKLPVHFLSLTNPGTSLMADGRKQPGDAKEEAGHRCFELLCFCTGGALLLQSRS